MLLRTLAVSMSGNALAGKGVTRAGKGTNRAAQNPLTNFKISK